MMRTLLLFAVALLGCEAMKAQGQADGGGPAPLQVAKWDGTYVGTWTSGAAEPGKPTPVVDYKLVVAGNYINVSVDGAQSMKRLSANAMAGGSALGAAFADCKPDDMTHCAGLSKGDRLFTVTNIRGTYLLRFEKLEAPDETTREVGLTKK